MSHQMAHIRITVLFEMRTAAKWDEHQGHIFPDGEDNPQRSEETE